MAPITGPNIGQPDVKDQDGHWVERTSNGLFEYPFFNRDQQYSKARIYSQIADDWLYGSSNLYLEAFRFINPFARFGKRHLRIIENLLANKAQTINELASAGRFPLALFDPHSIDQAAKAAAEEKFARVNQQAGRMQQGASEVYNT